MTKELAVESPKSTMLKTLEVINEQLKGIKALETSKFATNGAFKWNTNGNTIDLFKTTDQMLLISIYGALKDKSDSYEKAVKELKMNTYPVWKWQSYSFEDWAKDLKIRMAIVGQEELANKLKADKAKLEKFLSEEDQLEAALKSMNYLEE